jgi:hypothetical protein
MNFQDVITIVGLLGIGAITPKVFEYFSDRQKIKDQSKHDYKQVRYKALILLMYGYLDFEKRNEYLVKYNRNFQNKEALLEELTTEWTNMTLYSSDEVIKAMKKYIQSPNMDTYIVTTLAMRKDLYNIKTSLAVSDLKLD